MKAPGFVDAFLAHTRNAPGHTALIAASRTDRGALERFSFGCLHGLVVSYAAGLRRAGLRRGDRIVVAFDPSIDFYALLLAVLGTGGVAVLLDGPADRRRLADVVRTTEAVAVVGDPAALRGWWRNVAFARVRRYAPGEGSFGVVALDRLLEPGEGEGLERSRSDAPAVIAVGSTHGRTQSALLTHGTLIAQQDAHALHLPVGSDDVHLACAPGIVLHNLSLGATTVLAPAPQDPCDIIDMARRAGVNVLSATPARMRALVEHLGATGERIEGVRDVVLHGVRVPRGLCARTLEVFPGADGRVVYASADAGPIAHVTMAEMLTAPGEGALVGAPAAGVEVLIAELPDRIVGACDRLELIDRRARVGEILVRGPMVSRGYVGDADAEATRRVREPGGGVWHRTGDLGTRDRHGRLWLLGRRGDPMAVTPGADALGATPAIRRNAASVR